jgi:glucose-6-phosphate-specific signal transduction histidine kinase
LTQVKTGSKPALPHTYTVGPIDAAWHLLEFAFPALTLGAIAAALAKLVWRRELGRVPWRRLALWAAAAALLAQLAGLVAFGRDGKVATYGAMVLCGALALWWAGFVRTTR